MTGAGGPRAESRTLVHGIAWVGVFRWSSQVLTWAITLVVLRILSPRDYGIVGMTTFFLALAGVLSEFGIGGAIVALRDLSAAAERQLHALAILAGVLAAALAGLAAWPLSRGFHEPALVGVVMVLGSAFLLDGLRVVPVALLSRELEYRKASSVDLVRAVVAALVVLSLAVRGAGYWALVLGAVAGSGAASGWALWLRRIPWERPRAADLAEPVRYCRHLIVSRLAFSGYQNADFLVAGRLFGSAVLGQYNLAWTIASLPGEKLTNVVTAASTPFFSAIQHDRAQLASYYLRLASFLSMALWPALFGFMVVADLVIPLVLGPQWTPAVPLARALVLYAGIQSVSALNSPILFLTGHSRTGMRVSLLALLILPPAFYLGGRLVGVEGVAWAWTIMFPFVVAWPLATVLRSLNLRFWAYAAALRRSALMVLVMVGAVWLLRYAVRGRVSPPVELGLAIATGGLVYGALCWQLAREDFRLVFRTWRSSAKSMAAEA
ncbi:MAG TPA: oligosaccharide flippase family protein [Gemmatimonadales bacterium]|nr:oligosaccharide flippase family protein [Gemmatimonadales bacterium]